MYPHRDLYTFILYIIVGIVFIVSMYYVKKYSLYYQQHPLRKKRGIRKDRTLMWFLILFLDVFATFRLVTDEGIGGTDAHSYIRYFETCLLGNLTNYHEHIDAGYKAIFQLFRSFTDNYHYLFFFIYGFIAASFVYFIKEFLPPKTNYSPYILIIYTYVLGFSSERSTFGIAIILFSLVLLHRKKYFWAIVLASTSLLIHKACAIYVMAIPFYLFFRNRRFTIVQFLIFFLLALFVGTYLRDMFIDFASENDLQGSYGSYAQRSISSSFWDNAYRIAIEQLLLLVLCIAGRSRFVKHLETASPSERSKLNMLWILCMYDFILIPINFYINNWRSPEFLSLVRVVMWGEMLWLFTRNLSKGLQRAFSLVFASLFLLRMWLSFNRSAVETGLMPYIFSL